MYVIMIKFLSSLYSKKENEKKYAINMKHIRYFYYANVKYDLIL